MKTIIGIAISVTMAFCLISQNAQISAFAFYVCIFFNGLSWLGVLIGAVERAAEQIRAKAIIGIPCSLLVMYALIVSGHPMLAASSFVVKLVMYAWVFKPEGKAA